jgi:hypothetical protein
MPGRCGSPESPASVVTAPPSRHPLLAWRASRPGRADPGLDVLGDGGDDEAPIPDVAPAVACGLDAAARPEAVGALDARALGIDGVPLRRPVGEPDLVVAGAAEVDADELPRLGTRRRARRGGFVEASTSIRKAGSSSSAKAECGAGRPPRRYATQPQHHPVRRMPGQVLVASVRHRDFHCLAAPRAPVGFVVPESRSRGAQAAWRPVTIFQRRSSAVRPTSFIQPSRDRNSAFTTLLVVS